MKPTRICSINGCDRKHYARGWCEPHYKRWQRHGDPSAGTQRYATPEEAFAARVKAGAECSVWTGSTNGRGYGTIWVEGALMQVHRYAWERVNGPIPTGKLIDHICHNRACVDVAHLRIANKSQNNMNRHSANITSESGVRNVHKNHGSWKVRLRKGGKQHYYGNFDSIEEAAAVAERARRELFGEFAGKG